MHNDRNRKKLYPVAILATFSLAKAIHQMFAFMVSAPLMEKLRKK